MQLADEKELKYVEEAVKRKFEAEEKVNDLRRVRVYGKRMVKEFESKDSMRTAVEARKLCFFVDH